MPDESPRLVSLYFPLWGATFDSDDAKLVGGRVMACVPFDEEWRLVQKTDVAVERGLTPPPVCLVACEPMASHEDLDQTIHRAGEGLLRAARDAVVALRLFKPGWFLDPEFGEHAFTAPGVEKVQRRPGPYRQAFLAGVCDLPFTGYELRATELGSGSDRPGPVTKVWDLLQAYRASGGSSSAEIALENFNRSFGFQLTAVQRAADLFTALDAMFGGMSARRIGRVPLRRNSFGRRVRAALGALDATRHGGLAPEAEAAWLEAREGGRLIRNAIAHGQPRTVAEAAGASQERLQGIVRLLLRQYLEFAVRWAADDGEAIAARFRLPARAPLPVAYNKVLDAHDHGEQDSRNLLTFGLSEG